MRHTRMTARTLPLCLQVPLWFLSCVHPTTLDKEARACRSDCRPDRTDSDLGPGHRCMIHRRSFIVQTGSTSGCSSPEIASTPLRRSIPGYLMVICVPSRSISSASSPSAGGPKIPSSSSYRDLPWNVSSPKSNCRSRVAKTTCSSWIAKCRPANISRARKVTHDTPILHCQRLAPRGTVLDLPLPRIDHHESTARPLPISPCQRLRNESLCVPDCPWGVDGSDRGSLYPEGRDDQQKWR